MKSRTYQLSSRKNQFNGNDEIYFSHANTRLLSAEQLLDAICLVTSVAETFPGAPVGTRAVELTVAGKHGVHPSERARCEDAVERRNFGVEDAIRKEDIEAAFGQ